MTLLKYFTFFPVIVWIPAAFEPWIEAGVGHFLIAVAAIAGSHLALCVALRRIVKEHCNTQGLEDNQEDFPMKLGLRY
jgi:hypothetical protein